MYNVLNTQLCVERPFQVAPAKTTIFRMNWNIFPNAFPCWISKNKSKKVELDKLFWIVRNNSFIFIWRNLLNFCLHLSLCVRHLSCLHSYLDSRRTARITWKPKKTRFHKMSWNMKNLHVSWHFRPFLKNTINSIVLVSIVSNQCFSSKFGGSENQ